MKMKTTKILCTLMLVAIMGVNLNAQTTTTLSPAEDAYVISGTNANTNYSSGSTFGNLLIRNHPSNLNASNKAIMKFNVSGAGVGAIVTAKLRLYVIAGFPQWITAYATTDAWEDSTVTWATLPAKGDSIRGINVSGGGYREWTITAYVKAEATGDGMVSLILEAPNASTALFQVASSRNVDMTRLPQLVLDAPTLLPVSLSSFTGNAVSQSVVLNWSTASEQNSDVFRVQTSTNGTNFSEVGTVSAAGNSNSVVNYSFKHDNAPVGDNYYRLQQVDKNGVTKYSPIVKVAINSKLASISAYFKPAALMVNIVATKPVKTAVSVFELSGKQIAKQEVNLENGANQLSIPVNLLKGTYFISVLLDGKKYVQKVVSE